MHIMDIRSAELTKYAANALLASRVSFMNEIALFCEEVGADVTMVRKAIGADSRIGHKFLHSGVGWGGSCFPKDVEGLIHQGSMHGIAFPTVRAAKETNEQQKKLMFTKLARYFADQGGISGKTIGILGLSFKPNTDDMREASSLILIRELIKNGACLRLFDPAAMNNAKALLTDQPAIIWCHNEQETAEGADAVVLMTEWKQFRFLNFTKMLSSMHGNGFFDGRNQYDATEMANLGFDYFSIGRTPAISQSADCELNQMAFQIQ
jgi:UDPglucose 6-dehydrogenase